MIVAITFLSITLFISIIFLGFLFTKNVELQNKLNDTLGKMDQEKKNLDNLIEIEPGDNGIISNYKLEFNEDVDGENVKTPFEITYEVEVIEVSKDKLKVKATGFTSIDSIARDPKRKSGIIKFMEERGAS